MIYIPKEYNEILNIISNSKPLLNFLTDVGVLITSEDYYKIYNSAKTDEITNYISMSNKNTLKKIASVIFDYKEIIDNNSFTDLAVKKEFKEIRDELDLAFGIKNSEISSKIYREVFYQYKTNYVESFFQNNWQTFLPNVEVEELDCNPSAKAFVEGVMKIFDKFDNIITETKKFKSYDEIPFEYINYLTQLIGFEQKTLMLEETSEEEIRVLAKNILDIYSKKGTQSSFELLFNFLGFNVDITRYFFDRRYYYTNSNPETAETNNKSFKFYLTKNNPADNIKNAFEVYEVITENEFSYAYRVDNFDDLVEQYGLECVLGFDDFDKNGNFYEGDVYKYFKTNYITIVPKNKSSLENLTTNQLKTVSAILNLICPAFWDRDVILDVNGFANTVEKITLNGVLGHYINNKNKYENYEGFRIFDSEVPFFRQEENAILTRNENKYGTDSEKNELREYKKNNLHYQENDYCIIHDHSYYDSSKNTYKNASHYANSMGEGYITKTVGKGYIITRGPGRKVVLESDNLLNKINEISKEDEIVDTKLEPLMMKINKKTIVNINTTIGQGANYINENDINIKENVWPFAKTIYKPIYNAGKRAGSDDIVDSDQFSNFVPTFESSITKKVDTLYLPMHKDFYNSELNTLSANTFCGENTIRKINLNNNNKRNLVLIKDIEDINVRTIEDIEIKTKDAKETIIKKPYLKFIAKSSENIFVNEYDIINYDYNKKELFSMTTDENKLFITGCSDKIVFKKEGEYKLYFVKYLEETEAETEDIKIDYILSNTSISKNEYVFDKENKKMYISFTSKPFKNGDSYYGLKQINSFEGKIDKENGEYVIYNYDKYYNYSSEKNDINDNILYNYEHKVNWDILNKLNNKNENIIFKPIESEINDKPLTESLIADVLDEYLGVDY